MRIDEVIQQPGMKERMLKEDIMKSLHVAIAGEVVAYNADKRTATVQPVIRDWDSKQSPPLLLDVPVFMWGNFTFTPQKGDGCLVVCADSCIDAWLGSKGVSTPVVTRMHSLSDGFAFVGFNQTGGIYLPDALGGGGSGISFLDDTHFAIAPEQWTEGTDPQTGDAYYSKAITIQRVTAQSMFWMFWNPDYYANALEGIMATAGMGKVTLTTDAVPAGPISGYVRVAIYRDAHNAEGEMF